MSNEINNLDDYLNVKRNSPAVLFYFSTPDCTVCKVLKPKLVQLLNTKFPKITFQYVDLSKDREIAAQNSIFTVPTIQIYFEGKEFLRRSRNLSLNVLSEELSRPYKMLHD